MSVATMVAADIDLAFLDFAESITYRMIVNSNVNYSTGSISATTTNSTINAIISMVDPAEVSASNGRLQIGDIRILVRTANLPETPPSQTSRLVVRSVVYNIVASIVAAEGITYYIFGRKVTG